MCSKRCAKPVRPAFSFFEPTWNHWFTFTIGSLRSTWRITWSPFGSVYFSNSIFGMAAARAAVAEAFFRGGGLFRGGRLLRERGRRQGEDSREQKGKTGAQCGQERLLSVGETVFRP